MAELSSSIDDLPEDEHFIVPDAPVAASIPYRSRERGAARHFGFLPFFAKKPWPVVQEYIKHYTAPGDLVSDPFAGSGVTPVESLVLGRRAVAGDINPVARFITQSTAIAPVDLEMLRESYVEIEREVRREIEALDDCDETQIRDILSTLDFPRDPIPDTVRRAGADTLDQLHTPRQLAGLSLLRDAIERRTNPIARDLLRVALAGTVRYCNRMYILPYDGDTRRSTYRGDAGFLRRFSYSLASPRLFFDVPVWPTFEMRFKAVNAAKRETNGLIGSKFNPQNFTLTDVPAARIHEITGEGQVDYCFTDPPYSNDIHFLDLSTLWAAWLRLEITADDRRDELLLRNSNQTSRDHFALQFAEVAESIARSLKHDRWLTLVYKHRDLSLWQTIVEACEKSGLLFTNAVWQDVKIRSTRQIESPNINPKGDMYLNFRRMPRRQFEQVYGRSSPIPLPTQTNYVEHEIERLIVSYLGADIGVLASGVIQQMLNNRSYSGEGTSPERLTADIGKVLSGGKFTTWNPEGERSLWVMAPDTPLDLTLESTDRARYYVFEFLREHSESSEGDIRQHLLSRLAKSHDADAGSVDVAALLRNVGHLVAPRRWSLDVERLLNFKQLRLLFRPSLADELRERIERRNAQSNARPLRVDLEGLALLGDRLREANSDNPSFKKQHSELLKVTQIVLRRLETEFGDQIDQVVAIGDWSRYGVDLRNLPFEDIVFLIVVRNSSPSFGLYLDVADRVFSDLGDDDILAQFRLESVQDRQRAVAYASSRGASDVLGVPVLGRE